KSRSQTRSPVGDPGHLVCGNSSKLNDRMKLPLLPSFCKTRRLLSYRLFLILPAALVLGASALAQGTRLWTQSRFEEFEKGTPQGVAIASDGRLREGPALREQLTTPSTFVWSLAVDKAGTAYVGTGSPATVLRTGTQKGEKPFTLFESKDLSVEVVRL